MDNIISEVVAKNKHELSLNGDNLTKLLDCNGDKVKIPPKLFELKQINFLQLSNSKICEIPFAINEMTSLQKLLLFGNQISVIPDIHKLKNLSHLDLSNNSIAHADCDFSALTHLMTVNLSCNIITSCSIKSASIHVLNVSRNKLTTFPELFHSLTELHADNNEITDIPINVDEKLPNLKILDVSCNKISEIPKSLSALKLKNLNLKENPLKDKRLLKYVQQNQALKTIIDHVQKLGINAKAKVDENEKGNKSLSAAENEKRCNQIVIKKFDENFRVDYDMSVKNVRGFILCCVATNFHLTASNLKEFLQFQTKLHETLGKKREAATIATHDYDALNPKHLRYAAKHKNDIKIQPLNRRNTLTGSEYFESLSKEAEAYRKEKKRSQVPGLYKFLTLLEDKTEFAFLEINNGSTISLPPLTNSEVTKMSTSTKNVFIEVTSSQSAAICYQIMLELIKKMYEMNCSSDIQVLELQQVKITTTDNTLKTLFPSKTDLSELESDSLQIIRP